MRDKQEYYDKGFKALEQLWRIRNQLQVTNNWKCVANLVESADFCSYAINYRKYLRLRMFDIATAYKSGQQRLLKEKLFCDSLREVDTNIQALQNLLYNPPQDGEAVDEVDNVDDARSSSIVTFNTYEESMSPEPEKIAPKESKGEPDRTKRPHEPDNTVSWSLKLNDSFNKTSITIATSTASQQSSQSGAKKSKVKRFKDVNTKKVKRQQTGVPKLGKSVARKPNAGQGCQLSSLWKPSGTLSNKQKDENIVKDAKTVSKSLENVPEKVKRESTEPKLSRHFLPKLNVRGSEENMKSAYIARWAKNVSAESKAIAHSQQTSPPPQLKRGVTIHLPQIENKPKAEVKVPEMPESEKGLRKSFEFIKNNIGDRWMNLARHLPYTPSRSLALIEADIRDIQQRHTKLSEQAYQSLICWYKHSIDPVRESIYKLINTLSEIGEGRIAMHLKKMFGIQDQEDGT